MRTVLLGFALAIAPLAHADESPAAFLAAEAKRAADAPGRWVAAPLPPPRPAGLPAFVRGRLVCAANVNRYLAHQGVAGTGSNLALSFVRWGRATGPQPGAVQVERRRGGAHVKIVSHHDGRGWVCLNPSVRAQGWRLAPCGARNVIGWRAA